MSKGLGRGLGSLIPEKPKKTKISSQGREEDIIEVTTKEERENITYLSPSLIKANSSQPRKEFSQVGLDELSDSIKRYGIIQPLIVIRKGSEYELIAGERRLRASKLAELDQVPVIIRDYDQQRKLEVALIENLQREDLSPIETAMAYKKLVDDFNMTVQQVANSVGRSRSSVSNLMRLLNLPDEIQQAILKGQVTERNALWIAGLETEAKQMQVFRKMLHNNLTSAQLKEEVKRMGGTKQARIKQDPEDKEREQKLREALSTRVKIDRKKKGGTITVDFYSNEELDDIIDKIE
jgi:ParB family chromosome partitioning protein